MQRALTSGCHEDDLPPPHDPNHLAPPNHSWLSRLSSNHRRGSMGFSEIGGTSMIDDENSNSFQGKSNSNLLSGSSHFGNFVFGCFWRRSLPKYYVIVCLFFIGSCPSCLANEKHHTENHAT